MQNNHDYNHHYVNIGLLYYRGKLIQIINLLSSGLQFKKTLSKPQCIYVCTTVVNLDQSDRLILAMSKPEYGFPCITTLRDPCPAMLLTS